MPMPLEIVGLGKTEIRFVWDDDDQQIVGARDLRLRCTCALCQSETTGERLIDDDGIPETISVTHMELTGNYGVNIHFSDGHTTGIYHFRQIREIEQAGS